jgi:hypothetical protein
VCERPCLADELEQWIAEAIADTRAAGVRERLIEAEVPGNLWTA